MRLFMVSALLLISLSEGQAQEISPDSVIIKSVFFGGGSYVIDYEQIQEIKALLDKIPNLENYQISITSHTDNIGGKAYNEWLSEMRSESVIEELIRNQVPEERIFHKEFGQENPLYDNRTWQGRRLNRRVDIIFSPLLF